MRPPVQILGAGFSGLATAWALTRLGVAVDVHERAERPGGLIRTPAHALGSYETGANALLNTALVEELFDDLGLNICSPTRAARKKFIFRNGPSRWPLKFFETLVLLIKFGFAKVFNRVLPRQFETLEHWGRRVLGRSATRHLLAPAIQGIYAGDIRRLSASLILGRVLRKNLLPKPKVKGSVFPEHGMQHLIYSMVEKVEARGGRVHFQSLGPDLRSSADRPFVIATSAPEAAKALESFAPDLARQLASIEMLPLVVVQAFLPPKDRPLSGFGCLFPADAKFHSLGVLIDHCLYPHRVMGSAERWILGGSRNPEILDLDDAEILELVSLDHARLGGNTRPIGAAITRWPEALPHYTVELEQTLAEIELPKNIFLIGNYLGQIGLSQILARANDLAKEIATKYET